MWLGPLHDRDFCSKMLEILDRAPERFGTSKRIHGMVGTAADVSPLLLTLSDRVFQPAEGSCHIRNSRRPSTSPLQRWLASFTAPLRPFRTSFRLCSKLVTPSRAPTRSQDPSRRRHRAASCRTSSGAGSSSTPSRKIRSKRVARRKHYWRRSQRGSTTSRNPSMPRQAQCCKVAGAGRERDTR